MSESIKKSLSFDVGIINLAYCLMQIDYVTSTFSILDWGIINTADNRHKCPFIMRGDKVCNKIANQMLSLDNHNAHYSCKAHWNKRTPMLEEIHVNWIPFDQEDENEQTNNKEAMTCSYNKCKRIGNLLINTTNNINGLYCQLHHVIVSRHNDLICNHKGCNEMICNAVIMNVINKDEDGVDLKSTKIKIGWCESHVTIGYDDFRKSKTRKISQSANKIPLDLIGASMYRILDSKPDFLMVDEVLIENQPALINPTMKSVAMILYSYFLMNCLHKKEEMKSTVSNLSYCSASNKLKVGGDKVADKLETARTVAEINENDKHVYDITKETSVDLCKALIADKPEYLAMMNEHKKQDDLADAMLQAFVMNFSTIPPHYASMLATVDMSSKTKKISLSGKGRGRPPKTTKVVKAPKATKATKAPKATKATRAAKINTPTAVNVPATETEMKTEAEMKTKTSVAVTPAPKQPVPKNAQPRARIVRAVKKPSPVKRNNDPIKKVEKEFMCGTFPKINEQSGINIQSIAQTNITILDSCGSGNGSSSSGNDVNNTRTENNEPNNATDMRYEFDPNSITFG